MKKIHCKNKIPVIEYEKSNIYIIENILDISFCDILKNVIDTIPLTKLDIIPGNNIECNINYISDIIKTNDELYYEFSTDSKIYDNLLEKIKLKKSIYNNKLNGVTKKNIIEYRDKLDDVMVQIKELMKPINHKIVFDSNFGYILRKIHGGTRLHVDGVDSGKKSDTNINFIDNNKRYTGKMVRNASIIFTINDDYEGGEFCFPYYDIKLKLKKGSVIIFPPYWTHDHEVLSVENNTYRYTVSTWTSEKI